MVAFRLTLYNSAISPNVSPGPRVPTATNCDDGSDDVDDVDDVDDDVLRRGGDGTEGASTSHVPSSMR